MGILDRIKKRQTDGFKEFVINMETTGATSRSQIFTAGVLEDPIYMGYVMKNIRCFDDFLQLNSDDINAVLTEQEQLLGLFAKCVFGLDDTKIMALETVISRHFSKLKDELSYLKEVTPAEKEGAKFYLLKTVRKMQMEEKIYGFHWSLPPQDVYYPKINKDGLVRIYFESGVVAAEGMFSDGKRLGMWRHNYDNGSVLAEGDYFEGLKTGVWVFYYSNGNIKSQGKYKADLKHGLWKDWDRNEVMSQVEFNEGVRK
jgi:hypothetical protein